MLFTYRGPMSTCPYSMTTLFAAFGAGLISYFVLCERGVRRPLLGSARAGPAGRGEQPSARRLPARSCCVFIVVSIRLVTCRSPWIHVQVVEGVADAGFKSPRPEGIAGREQEAFRGLRIGRLLPRVAGGVRTKSVEFREQTRIPKDAAIVWSSPAPERGRIR